MTTNSETEFCATGSTRDDFGEIRCTFMDFGTVRCVDMRHHFLRKDDNFIWHALIQTQRRLKYYIRAQTWQTWMYRNLGDALVLWMFEAASGPSPEYFDPASSPERREEWLAAGYALHCAGYTPGEYFNRRITP